MLFTCPLVWKLESILIQFKHAPQPMASECQVSELRHVRRTSACVHIHWIVVILAIDLLFASNSGGIDVMSHLMCPIRPMSAGGIEHEARTWIDDRRDWVVLERTRECTFI